MENARYISPKEVGRLGEEACLAFLVQKKWKILHKNWRPEGAAHGLELDIVAVEKDTLVFVEVKSRLYPAGTEENIPVHLAFSPAKRTKTAKAAHHYLSVFQLWHMPCRFDLVCVSFTAKNFHRINHYEHVIEAGKAMDSGNTPWQPW